MILRLRILTYRNLPHCAASVSFTAAGGTIGRGSENLLILDDPIRHISRVHARIALRGATFYLEDVGSNPSVINDQPLNKGQAIAIGDGDSIVVGDYKLIAALEAENAGIALSPVPPDEGVESPSSVSYARVDASSAAGPDPLLLNLPDPSCEGVADTQRTVLRNPGKCAIPANYDPLAGAITPTELAPPPVVAQAAEPPLTLPEHLAGDCDDEVLLALLRGLGLPTIKPCLPAADTAEILGAMLRVATAGTIDVLMARALTKRESRIPLTMLAVRENNPLKFFPNADAALSQMLGSAKLGYMEPVAAISAAFDDLRTHELAIMAGMHAALNGVLKRFNPARMAHGLAEPNVTDRLFGAQRKAKLWDRLVQQYAGIAHAAEEDAQNLFGQSFSQAYEEQVARLRHLKDPGDKPL